MKSYSLKLIAAILLISSIWHQGMAQDTEEVSSILITNVNVWDGTSANVKAVEVLIEKNLIKLVTSQINGCRYCQSAHTAMGKMIGFADEQIIEIRQGSASFDTKLDALVKFAASLVTNRGNASQETKNAFFAAGYNEANMIDVVMVIGDMAITNSIHQLAGFEIDFPLAPELTQEVV